jgi:hypothetical protein
MLQQNLFPNPSVNPLLKFCRQPLFDLGPCGCIAIV